MLFTICSSRFAATQWELNKFFDVESASAVMIHTRTTYPKLYDWIVETVQV